MANLSYKARRMLARGLNRAHVANLGGRNFWGIGNRALQTTALAGANNDMTFIARTPGVAGNAITVAIVVPAVANQPLSVAVVGNAITINAATGATISVSTTTAAQAVAAVNAHAVASTKVWASVAAPGNDGTGLIVARAATALAGAV